MSSSYIVLTYNIESTEFGTYALFQKVIGPYGNEQDAQAMCNALTRRMEYDDAEVLPLESPLEYA